MEKRLKDLYALYEQIRQDLLGRHPRDRGDLERLKKRVVQEIKDIERAQVEHG